MSWFVSGEQINYLLYKKAYANFIIINYYSYNNYDNRVQ